MSTTFAKLKSETESQNEPFEFNLNSQVQTYIFLLLSSVKVHFLLFTIWNFYLTNRNLSNNCLVFIHHFAWGCILMRRQGMSEDIFPSLHLLLEEREWAQVLAKSKTNGVSSTLVSKTKQLICGEKTTKKETRRCI